MYFFLLALVLGAGVVVGRTSKENSEDTPSKLTSGFLKTRSAGRDLSYSSSFGSEDFDSPDIPSDFHARFGINKTWGIRTPHPILSRRASFEDYGRPRVLDNTESGSYEDESSSKHGEDHKKLGMALSAGKLSSTTIKKNTTLNAKTNKKSPKQNPNMLPTTHKTTKNVVPHLLKTSQEHKHNQKAKVLHTQTKSAHSENKLEIGTKLGTKLNEEVKTTLRAMTTNSKFTEKPSFQSAITHGRKIEQPKTHLQRSQVISTERILATAHETSEIIEHQYSTASPMASQHHTQVPSDSLHFVSTETLSPTDDHSKIPTHTTAPGEFSGGHHYLSTVAASRLKTRTWGPALPKMDRSKKRKENVIVLKPPPEDWPEPKMPDGAKPFPPAPKFGATVPAFDAHMNPRIHRKGKAFSASSYASPPYMGHRKLEFAEGEQVITPAASAKWRIKGRRDRLGLRFRGQKGGGYLNEIGKDPGFRKDVRPTLSQFFISDNTTFLIPTVRNTRPYQRSYVNFRFRPPVNVGRSHGPPPFAQPPPPHFASHFGQPHFPQFPQRPFPPFPPPPPYGPPPYPPPPPFGQGPPPPPPPPPFGQGLSPHFRRGPLPPKFAPEIPSAPPPEMVMIPQVPLPRGPPDPFPAGPPPPPPSPYPTGPNLPPPRPFLDNIPTISPIDGIPAPWPRRLVQTDFLSPLPRVPDMAQEPRNFSGYKGPRRGRAYEQYGKADLRPRQVKLFDDVAFRGAPRMPVRKGSGFGVEFQDDITRPPFMSGSMFARRTWATRSNRFGYEPYRRSSDRRRPYGFGRYAAERPPVLGDFGEFKPYKRLNDGNYVPFNYSRPTRSYTFPPRLRLAIKNATYYRKSFRRSSYPGYTLPTLPSIGLEAFMAHKQDYYGNPITPKGRIMNLQDLKNLFTVAPEGEGVEAVEAVTAPIVVTEVPEEKKGLVPRITPKPKGMTAREAMRAAAREAIKETELEAWEAGEGRRRRGGRRVGGAGPFVRRGGARGTGQRNFRRMKRSVEEDAAWLEKQKMLRQELYDSGDYLTGPGAQSTSSSSAGRPRRGPRSKAEPPLRMRRVLLRRGKGRPLRHS